MNNFGINFLAGVASGVVLMIIAWIFSRNRKRKRDAVPNEPILAPHQIRALMLLMLGLVLLFVPSFVPQFEYGFVGMLLMAWSLWTFLD